MGYKASLPILLVLLSLMASSAFSLRLLSDDLINPSPDIPHEAEIRRCQAEHCQDRGQGLHAILRCLQSCERRYEDDIVLVLLENHHEDQAQRQLQMCHLQCDLQHGGSACREMCDERFERQTGHREGSRRYDEDEEVNPRGSKEEEERYKQCGRRCKSDFPYRGQEGKARQCLERCREDYEKQHEEGGKRQQRGDEVNPREREEEEEDERYKQCGRRCKSDFPYRGQEGKAMQCLERCREDYEKQHEEDGDEVNPRGSEEEERYKQCGRRCKTDFPHRGQEGEAMQCLERCREDYEKQHGGGSRRQQRGDEVNPRGSEEVERKYKQCKRRCGSDFPHRGQEGESMQCIVRCYEDYKKQQEEGGGRQYA